MKSGIPTWEEHLFGRASRRDFLRLGAHVTGLVALGALPGCGREPPRRFSEDPYPFGVASGDPAPDGVVLWTRLGAAALEAAGAANEPVRVRWEVAEDDSFRRIVATGSGTARPELGHSVHVEIGGLRSAADYFYRLVAGDVASPVGRTRTAPAPDAVPESVRFAYASCQHYETGWYTALAHMARESADFIVHLGDYIYESGAQPRVRAHEGPEVVTLDQYRGRYETYRTDADLRSAHASAPWIVTWDDHEVDNDYADDTAEDDRSPADFLIRRAAAYQAYYEFMPLRRSSMPSGPAMQLYRSLPYGSLLDMRVLDTRQYRSDQPCSGWNRRTCPEHTDPARTLLGADQRAWLYRGLAASRARWSVIAQQILVARLRGRHDDGSETWPMDQWDGYPHERQGLLDHLADAGVRNAVVLTGDIHSNWVTDLHADFDDLSSPIVATEFAGTSIASGGDGAPMSAGGRRALELNPHVRFYNGQRGYVVATVTPDRWTTEFRVVPFVSEPGADLDTAATFVVEVDSPGAQEA